MRVLTVPVKSLARAKSRLAPLLSPGERAVLSLAMLEGVLDACEAQPDWETWVISGDPVVLDLTARRGGRAVPEEGRSLLAAVRQVEAEMTGLAGPGGRLAVLLADLPFLTARSLATALVLGDDAPVVAAPAESDAGTNLLVRHPPAVIPARFGRDSFAKHLWAARRGRVPLSQAPIPELAFDLDRPDDLVRVLASNRPGRTLSTCLDMGLAARLRERA
jgi:2-phospho-L-lactate guanylyltransferase